MKFLVIVWLLTTLLVSCRSVGLIPPQDLTPILQPDVNWNSRRGGK
jgi:hypothetical protein